MGDWRDFFTIENIVFFIAISTWFGYTGPDFVNDLNSAVDWFIKNIVFFVIVFIIYLYYVNKREEELRRQMRERDRQAWERLRKG